MTKKEIVEKFLDRNNLEFRKGDSDHFDPILPWLMMDVQYQLFCKHIKPLDCAQILKQIRTRWNECYNKFNKSFFSIFTEDEKSDIVDMMDDFENYISNDVEIARIQFMNAVSFYPSDLQDIIASGMMCNVLSQCANIIYRNMFKTGRLHERQENPYIRGITFNSYKFVNAVHCEYSDAEVNFNGNKNIEDAVQILQNKMIKWLKTN